jgi:hypothetical protein
VESMDNLIDTLEILSSALSARDKNKALGAIAPLLQQFTATFGHATHIFLAILFLQTLKVHILCDEFAEASGGALTLLARLKAVNTAIKQSAVQSAPADSDALAEDVLDDVLNAEIAPGSALPPARYGGARGWGGWRRSRSAETHLGKSIRSLLPYQVYPTGTGAAPSGVRGRLPEQPAQDGAREGRGSRGRGLEARSRATGALNGESFRGLPAHYAGGAEQTGMRHDLPRGGSAQALQEIEEGLSVSRT